MNYDEELAAVKSLYDVHQSNKDVYVTNGLLRSVEKNQDLIDALTPEQQEFLKKSIQVYDEYHHLQYEANQENVNALAEQDKIIEDLRAAKEEAEKSTAEAERLSSELKKDRDEIKDTLEQQAQYNLQAKRQQELFSFARELKWPAFGFLFCLLITTTVLHIFDKETQAYVTILSIAVGTLLSAFAHAVTSLFTPTVKEEKNPSNKEPVSSPESTK